MYFPDTSLTRQRANAILQELGLADGYAKIRENRKSKSPAYDVVYKRLGARRGTVVFTIIFFQ